MFALFVSLRVQPVHAGAFLEALKENAEASLRDEPGCLRFDVHRSSEEPGHFMLYEIYEDAAAFHEGHRNAPHLKRFRELTDPMLEPDGRLNIFCTPVFVQEPVA